MIRLGKIMVVQITRTDRSAEDLRREARRVADAKQSRRLLALALLLEGASRHEAARMTGMDRQTLRDWVHRYNAEGVAGLTDRPRSGRPPLLAEGQLAEFDRLVETGPDPVKDGVVRWRCLDLKTQIATCFGIQVSERSVGRILGERGFRRLSPRPKHPKTNEAAQEAFKQTFSGS
jgi:transposase